MSKQNPHLLLRFFNYKLLEHLEFRNLRKRFPWLLKYPTDWTRSCSKPELRKWSRPIFLTLNEFLTFLRVAVGPEKEVRSWQMDAEMLVFPTWKWALDISRMRLFVRTRYAQIAFRNDMFLLRSSETAKNQSWSQATALLDYPFLYAAHFSQISLSGKPFEILTFLPKKASNEPFTARLFYVWLFPSPRGGAFWPPNGFKCAKFALPTSYPKSRLSTPMRETEHRDQNFSSPLLETTESDDAIEGPLRCFCRRSGCSRIDFPVGRIVTAKVPKVDSKMEEEEDGTSSFPLPLFPASTTLQE